MPCVFPVLAVKAVALAGLSGGRRRHAVAHALSYTAGVVATFLLVGVVLLALRASRRRGGLGISVPVAGLRRRHHLHRIAAKQIAYRMV